MRILFEDKNIIVIEKAPGESSQGDKKGDVSLLDTIKAHMASHGQAGKNPYVVHRLDRPVGGIMVYAKTKESASDLSRQVQAGKLRKKYLAVVCGKLETPQGELKHHLLKDEANNCSHVVSEDTKGAKEAILRYRLQAEIEHPDYGILSLVEVLLITGRHHQIRVQLAELGCPIWGDTKYNPQFSEVKAWHHIALFASYLTFYHPVKNAPLKYEEKPSPTEMPWCLFNL